MRTLLRPRGLGKKSENELKMWIQKVDQLDKDQAEVLEKRMDEGWKGSSVALTEANRVSHAQLEEIGSELCESVIEMELLSSDFFFLRSGRVRCRLYGIAPD